MSQAGETRTFVQGAYQKWKPTVQSSELSSGQASMRADKEVFVCWVLSSVSASLANRWDIQLLAFSDVFLY